MRPNVRPDADDPALGGAVSSEVAAFRAEQVYEIAERVRQAGSLDNAVSYLRAALEVVPPPDTLNDAALDAAERAYWHDDGVSRHNLAAAIQAYLASRPPEEPPAPREPTHFAGSVAGTRWPIGGPYPCGREAEESGAAHCSTVAWGVDCIKCLRELAEHGGAAPLRGPRPGAFAILEAENAKLRAALEDVAFVAGGKAAERIHDLLRGVSAPAPSGPDASGEPAQP